MRAIKVIFIFLIIVPSWSNAQWQWQNPLPQGNTISNIRFLDENTGYAVGAGGTILKTVDEGDSWTILNSGIQERLLDIYFPSTNLGFAVTGERGNSQSKIIRTQDSGETWDIVFDDLLGSLRTVYFASQTNGFAGGDSGLLLKTIDAGSTWTILHLGSKQTIHEIIFTDPLTGFIVGDYGTILRTANGGATWYDVSVGISDSYEFFAVTFPTDSIGYIVGYSSGKILLKSTNAGETWNVIDQGYGYPFDLEFSTPDSGIMLYYSESAKRTIDGGSTWEEIEPFFHATHLDYTNPSTAYFVQGDDGGMFQFPLIQKTSDFGTSIQCLTPYVTLTFLNDIDFPTRSTGYCLGNYYSHQHLIKTTNGYDWETNLELFDDSNIQPDTLWICMDFLSEDIGYIAGCKFFSGIYLHEGFVIKTTNGGTSWEYLDTGFPMRPWSIYFKNPNEGYITGINMDYANWKTWVIKTSDGGQSWQEVMSDTVGYFNLVTFPAFQVGYIHQTLNESNGWGVAIWKSINGGLTWQKILNSDTIGSHILAFPDPDIGYMCHSAKLLKSTDGGYTWAILPGFNYTVQNLMFLNVDTGFALAHNGLLETTDGGLTWNGGEFITSNSLQDLFFFSPDTGYVIGMNGSVLYTPSDYFPVFQEEILSTSHRSLYVYPNPCSSNVTLNYSLTSVSDLSIKLYQLSGVLLSSTYILKQPAGKHEINIDVSELEPGLYLLRLFTNSENESVKLIVIH